MIESLYLLLPLSVLFAIAIGVAFWWAIFSGQFDDLQRVGNAVLEDDDSTESHLQPDLAQSRSDPDSVHTKAN